MQLSPSEGRSEVASSPALPYTQPHVITVRYSERRGTHRQITQTTNFGTACPGPILVRPSSKLTAHTSRPYLTGPDLNLNAFRSASKVLSIHLRKGGELNKCALREKSKTDPISGLAQVSGSSGRFSGMTSITHTTVGRALIPSICRKTMSGYQLESQPSLADFTMEINIQSRESD